MKRLKEILTIADENVENPGRLQETEGSEAIAQSPSIQNNNQQGTIAVY